MTENATVDITLLKVKGNIENQEERRNYLKQLAKAIIMVVHKHNLAKLRCVGAAAVSNAVKAHIIANGESTKNGILLVGVPSFQTINFEGVGEKTSIVIELRPEKINASVVAAAVIE